MLNQYAVMQQPAVTNGAARMLNLHSAFRSATSALFLVFACTAASCQTTPVQPEPPPKSTERRGTHVWIERPWEMRYFLMVTKSWASAKRVAVKRNNKVKPDRPWLSW